MPSIEEVQLTPEEEGKITEYFNKYVSELEKEKSTLFSSEHKAKWLSKFKTYILEVKDAFYFKGGNEIWGIASPKGVSPFEELLTYLVSTTRKGEKPFIWNLQPVRIFRHITLTESESDKLENNFNAYIKEVEEKIRKEIDSEVKKIWIKNYKAYFRNLKQFHCEEIDNPDDSNWKIETRFASLDDKKQQTDFLYFQPMDLLKETFESQKKYIEEREKLIKQEIAEILSSISQNGSTPGQNNEIDKQKIKEHEKILVLIEDYKKHITAVQQYLEDSKAIDRTHAFSKTKFSSIYKLYTVYNIEEINKGKNSVSYEEFIDKNSGAFSEFTEENASFSSVENKLVYKNDKFLAELKATNILFLSATGEDLSNNIIRLQKNSNNIKTFLTHEKFLMDLYMAERLHAKYKALSTMKLLERKINSLKFVLSVDKEKILKEIKEKGSGHEEKSRSAVAVSTIDPSRLKRNIKTDNPDFEEKKLKKQLKLVLVEKISDENLAKEITSSDESLEDFNARYHKELSKAKLTFDKADSDLKDILKDRYSGYIQKIFEEAKTECLKLWEKKLEKYKDQIQDKTLLETEDLAKLGDKERHELGKTSARQDDIPKLQSNLKILDNLNFDTLDNLTEEQAEVLFVILEEIKNTKENMEAYNELIRVYSESTAIKDSGSGDVKEETAFNLTSRSNVYKREASTFIDIPEDSKPTINSKPYKQPIYLRTNDAPGNNVFYPIETSQQAVESALCFFNKSANYEKMIQPGAFVAAIRTLFDANKKLEDMSNKIAVIDETDNLEKLSFYEETEKFKGKGKKQELGFEEQQKNVNIAIESILQDFIADFTTIPLEAGLEKAHKKILEDISSALFNTTKWYEEERGIKHPIAELLIMLEKCSDSLPLSSKEKEQSLDTNITMLLLLNRCKTPLKNIKYLLEKYKERHSGSKNQKEFNDLFLNVMKLLNDISEVTEKVTDPKNIEEYYTNLLELKQSLIKYIEVENKNGEVLNKLEESILILYGIAKQIDTFLSKSNAETWINRHMKFPVYSLIKLKNEIKKMIELANDPKITEILKSVYLSKINDTIAMIHVIHGRSEEDIKTLEDIYGEAHLDRIEPANISTPPSSTSFFSPWVNAVSDVSESLFHLPKSGRTLSINSIQSVQSLGEKTTEYKRKSSINSVRSAQSFEETNNDHDNDTRALPGDLRRSNISDAAPTALKSGSTSKNPSDNALFKNELASVVTSKNNSNPIGSQTGISLSYSVGKSPLAPTPASVLDKRVPSKNNESGFSITPISKNVGGKTPPRDPFRQFLGADGKLIKPENNDQTNKVE